MKTCSKCKKNISTSLFAIDRTKKDGLYSSCNNCRYALYSKNPNYNLYKRKIVLKLKYGITLEDYAEMFKKQNGLCAICGGINKNGWNLAVDHNHKNGKIRELLCTSCNVILGTAYDNVEILKKAIKYLEKHNA